MLATIKTAFVTLALAVVALPSAAQVAPLPQAHAHNDYEHARPLLDALDHGFTSVEADVWLVGDRLLVAHEEAQVQRERTLEALYLEPLKARLAANGGSVYRGHPGFTLLVDIKSDHEPSYAALDRVLTRYADMLTIFRDGAIQPGPVQVVVSGNRPRATMLAQPLRLAGYDGRVADLATDLPASFMPLISDSWARTFTWTGTGPMPEDERRKLDTIVSGARGRGQRVRFWATPDQPGPERNAVWRILREAGVDHINTDDLAGLRAFLTGS